MEGVVASWGQLNREKSLILFRFEEEEKKKRWPTHGKRITPNANMDDKLFFLFFLLLGSPIFSKGFSLKLSSEQREVRERETDSDREKEWNREKNSGWKGKKKKKKEIYVHPSFRFLFYLFLDEIVNLDLIELITANLPCISVYNLKRKISEQRNAEKLRFSRFWFLFECLTGWKKVNKKREKERIAIIKKKKLYIKFRAWNNKHGLHGD